MIKGGYKIVNFNGAALSGSSETLPGIYDQIVDDYDKPVMVSGVSLNGDIMDDAYAGVQEKIAGDLSKSVELTVYGGIITVTEDDEVTFVLSKTTAELTAEIGDLDDLDTTEKGSLVGAINEVKGDVSDISEDPNITTPNLVSTNYTTILAGLAVGKCAFVTVDGEVNLAAFNENVSAFWLVRRASQSYVDILAITAASKYLYKSRYSVTDSTFGSKFVFEGTALT